MELPDYAVKIWIATQQIKHPRIMAIWIFWSSFLSMWHSVLLYLFFLSIKFNIAEVTDSWRDETTHAQDPGIKYFPVSVSNRAMGFVPGMEIALEILKRVVNQFLKLPIDPEMLLSQKLHLLRQCWLTASLLFMWLSWSITSLILHKIFRSIF